MRLSKIFAIIFLFSLGFIGCYTIITHPTVKKDGYSQRVKFYNDCFSCHSNSEMIEYGYDYLEKYPADVVVTHPIPIWVEPIYTPPWWVGIRIPVVEDNQPSERPNDRTRLRDLDGGRSSAPTDFSIPSRNSGSSSSSSSSSSSNNNSTNSTNERNSRESNSTKSRDNSGERKK
ncbi:MAG: hypothetical protein N3F03_08735 [Ignavibacteria bacterium]|nr:hypothetical protein [Ignavibacteria bacterium]